AVERLDRQHVGQAQHRVWTTENLLGGLVEDFQLTPVEAGAAIARLVNRGVIQPVPGHPDQYQHEGGSTSEVGGTF
ncbi:MAG TPA: hypothetical protein VL737_03920, partial [Candidatus Pristimantibacillus sp.]|nr:hypothetical protein [Candidatus Pristimantibacillus sp.]